MNQLPKRTFLMLPKVYDPDRYTVGGHYLSEKLEGVRAFWDGGMSRGKATTMVPWANPHKNPKTATGLWSIHGTVITASDKFLNTLPCMPLDGVLWAGRGECKTVREACGGGCAPGPLWDNIEYAVTSTPSLAQMFRDGEIKTAWGFMRFRGIDAIKWMQRFSAFLADDFLHLATDSGFVSFDTELAVLSDCLPLDGPAYLHRQVRLPFGVKDAARAVKREVEKLTKLGAAGALIRSPDSRWEPRRTSTILKYEIK